MRVAVVVRVCVGRDAVRVKEAEAVGDRVLRVRLRVCEGVPVEDGRDREWDGEGDSLGDRLAEGDGRVAVRVRDREGLALGVGVDEREDEGVPVGSGVDVGVVEWEALRVTLERERVALPEAVLRDAEGVPLGDGDADGEPRETEGVERVRVGDSVREGEWEGVGVAGAEAEGLRERLRDWGLMEQVWVEVRLSEEEGEREGVEWVGLQDRAEGVGVGEREGVPVGVALGLPLAVHVGEAVAVALCVAVSEDEEVREGEAEGVPLEGLRVRVGGVREGLRVWVGVPE